MTDSRGILLLITVRGGSKRLPAKHLRAIAGVTLLGRAVRRARYAGRHLSCPARIVVSTDSEDLAAHARSHGAETPFIRPAELATDTATSVSVVRHAVAWFRERGIGFAEIALLQATSPLCEGRDVVDAVRAFRADPLCSLATVRPATHAGPGLSFEMVDERLQDAPTAGGSATRVELNGAVYVLPPDWLEAHDRLVEPGLTRACLMPAERSVDVDTQLDLQLAAELHQAHLPWPAGRCLIIAEAGVNHGGSRDEALRLIDVAAEAGADAVKFQTFSADRIALLGAPKAAYQARSPGASPSQYEMLKALALSEADHQVLWAHCRDRGITFLSSAFSEEDVNLLDRLGVAAIKLGSGELTNHPLLEHTGATTRPVILSTGGSYLAEVLAAVEVLRGAGCSDLALLHCVSSYPAEARDVNLAAMHAMGVGLGLPVGFSDHTSGIEICCAAVAMGARIVEKHFTRDRTADGPDHAISLEPAELQVLVRALRNVELARGDGVKAPTASESETRAVARKSLVAHGDLCAGTLLSREHVVAKRPAGGICPSRYRMVIGSRLTRDLAANEVLHWSDLQLGADG